MKYRIKSGKVLGDKAILTDISKGISTGAQTRMPILTRMLSGVIGYFVSTAAFISKCLLRKRLGERTFGLLTFFSVYLVIWIMYLFPQAYGDLAKDEFFTTIRDSLGGKFLVFISTIFYLPYLVAAEIFSLEEVDKDKLKLDPELSTELSWLFTAILITGIVHLLEVYLRRWRKQVVHSYHSGDSLIFNKLIGKEVFKYQISATNIWMIAEPVLVILVAFVVKYWFQLDNLFIVLLVSGICLFLEEYKIKIEKRNIILDFIDGQLDADFIDKVQKEYQQELEVAKKESPEEFRASFGQNNGIQDSGGSDSPFRVRIN